MVTIAKIIAMTLKQPKDEATLAEASRLVAKLTDQYPLYAEMKY